MNTDPNRPPPLEPGHNPPRYPDPDKPRMTGGLALGLMVAAALVVGAAFYVMKSDPSTTTAANPPPTTTGQGSPRTMEPVIDRVTPVPMAPAPGASADDPAKPAVDLEESPTMPKQP